MGDPIIVLPGLWVKEEKNADDRLNCPFHHIPYRQVRDMMRARKDDSKIQIPMIIWYYTKLRLSKKYLMNGAKAHGYRFFSRQLEQTAIDKNFLQ